jgi:hypothetical protein
MAYIIFLQNEIMLRDYLKGALFMNCYKGAQVCIQAEHVGFVVDKAALGQVFSKYFNFSIIIMTRG